MRTGLRICSTDGCGNAARKGGTKCNTCHSRANDRRNPKRRAYRNLKAHARERGKPFDLAFPDFEALCDATGYHLHRGNDADGLTIDRVRNEHGYTAGNVQVITNAENARKEQLRRQGVELGDADESVALR